jgi:hypothetical protein
MRQSETRSGEVDRPDWLPDEYDPDAPLRERLPIMAEIDGGIELHVTDDRGVTEIVGQPVEFTTSHSGVQKLKAGSGPNAYEWSWEIIVPEEAPARLMDVDPMQDFEVYQKTKSTELTDIDVRLWGVDAKVWLERRSDDAE